MSTRFSLEAVFKAKDRFSRPIARMSSRVDRFTRRAGRGFRRLTRNLNGVGVSFGTVATAATAAGTAAGFALGSVIKTGSDFEQAIANVGAVSLKTRDEIKDLEAEALRLGATTKFTATEAAQGMEIMARAGFKNQEILGGIGGILNAAAASGLELAEVSDHVSNVLKGMGLETSQAARVSDVLALASARTNSTIGTLGESMRNVASTARQFGIPLEDVVAGVAALQDVGLDASVAGSAMNVMLTKLAKPSAEIAAQMKAMGVTFQDTHGNMLAFPKVLENIAIASEKSGGNMKQAAFLADLVGLRGQKAAANLQDLFRSGKLSSLTKELKNASGAAEKMAKLRMDSLQGDWALFGSAVDGVKTALFDLEGGGLRSVVQGMTDWVSANKGDIVSGVKKALPVLKELGGIFGDSFSATLKEIGASFDALFPNTSGPTDWIAITKSVAKNLGELAGVAVAGGAAIAVALRDVFVVANTLWSGLRSGLEATITFVGERVFAITDWFADLGAKFDQTGVSLTEKMKSVGAHIVQGLWRGIKGVATLPVDAVKDIGGAMLSGIKSSLGIKSPSTEMAAAGRFAALGLAQGLNREASSVKRAVSGLASVVASEPIRLSGAPRAALGGSRRRLSASLGAPMRRASAPMQTVSPTRLAQTEVRDVVREEVSRAELVIRDETGRAQLKAPKRMRSRIVLQPSGAF